MNRRVSTWLISRRDDEHRQHRAEAARRHHPPGVEHRVIQQNLHHRRHQRQGAAEDHADPEHQQTARDEIRALQQFTIEKRALAGRHGVNDQQVEAQCRDRRLDPDFGRVEPVPDLAAVEHQLQRADRDAQHCKAEHVELLAPHWAGLTDEDKYAERDQRPNGRLM